MSNFTTVPWRKVFVFLMLCLPGLSNAATCDTDNFETQVSGVSQCLMMKRYGADTPKAIVIWLHGDLSSGAAANYHFPLAKRTAEFFSGGSIMSVALVRPGYPDGSGQSSSVDLFHAGRTDHYTRENIEEIAGAISKLQKKFSPAKTILVGHSGGAAISAVLAGLHPGLVNAAILVACPCDLARWRQGRRTWTRSEDPAHWINKVPTSTTIIAMTGDQDDNTGPALAESYIQAQRGRGLNATFELIRSATHNSAIRSEAVLDAIARSLESRLGER
jgi:pimeloyl-ACP methyl ester carboxylesterase